MKKPSASMLTDGRERMDRLLQEYKGLNGTVRQWDGQGCAMFI